MLNLKELNQLINNAGIAADIEGRNNVVEAFDALIIMKANVGDFEVSNILGAGVNKTLYRRYKGIPFIELAKMPTERLVDDLPPTVATEVINYLKKWNIADWI